MDNQHTPPNETDNEGGCAPSRSRVRDWALRLVNAIESIGRAMAPEDFALANLLFSMFVLVAGLCSLLLLFIPGQRLIGLAGVAVSLGVYWTWRAMASGRRLTTIELAQIVGLLLMRIGLAAFVFGFVAYTFASLYQRVGLIDGDGNRVESFLDCLYFSVVTLSTVGYGDITPMPAARPIVIIEIICGFMLLAVLMGLSASLFTPRRSDRDEPKPELAPKP
ncbi:MAG: potassium channel family protein [Planctomycetaceae bacterium]